MKAADSTLSSSLSLTRERERERSGLIGGANDASIARERADEALERLLARAIYQRVVVVVYVVSRRRKRAAMLSATASRSILPPLGIRGLSNL